MSKADVEVAQRVEASPWQRLDTESVQAFARFTIYRNLPASQRSLAKVGVNIQLANRWSKKYKWVERARSWDEWLLTSGDALGVQAVNEARLLHLKLGNASVNKALACLPRIKLTSADAVVTLGGFGAELTRKTLGLDTTKLDNQKLAADVTVNVHGIVAQGTPNTIPHVARRKTYEEISGTRSRNKLDSKGESSKLINDKSGHNPNGARPALLPKPTASLRESAGGEIILADGGDDDVIDISIPK